MSVFVFPGQGSQTPGMGRYLFDNFNIAKQTYEEANDSLKLDIKKLCFEGPETELAKTENTQPALVATSIATYRVLKSEAEIPFLAAAGHSVGEYSALVAAGAMRFADALRAVRLRGRAMQEAVPLGTGGMFAVLGLDEMQCAYLCRWVTEQSQEGPLAPANFNCPGQIVISGSQKALDWLKANFKPDILPGEPKRAKLIALNVSAPFHCSMMKPAEVKMREFLESIEFVDAKVDVIQNFTAKKVRRGSHLKENLVQQICAPVLWTQSMQTLKEEQHLNVIECGHGNVLRGLFKKFDSESFKVFGSSNIEELQTSFQLKL